MKKIKQFIPLIVGVLVILILIGVRAWGLSHLPKDGRWPNVAGGMYDKPVMKNGVEYYVPPDEIYENGLGKNGLPALNSATYVTVAVADDVLADDVEGIDVAVNGKHRFYSFQILNWHGLVNDRFGDKDLLVSYSSLCGSAVVYDRVVEDGITRTFGDNGQVYNNCPVLYDDKSEELWDQANGLLISGHEHSMRLARYPSAVLTWSAWKDANPNGEVLSTETGFTRDYRRHPYGNYDKNASLFFPTNKTDARLAVKDFVDDYELDYYGEVHVGASAKFLSFAKEPNYTMDSFGPGGSFVVDFTAFVDANNKAHLFSRSVDGQLLTFVRENNEIKDKETDSRWTANGLCIKGKMKGKKLDEMKPTGRYFAFAYVSHFPKATLLGADAYDLEQAKAETPKAVNPPTEINVTP
ncbi:MAG: DUF3179 domain-containing (seleno)protein [Patescibacteria group bacterium]|jgi:hypothetical protein